MRASWMTDLHLSFVQPHKRLVEFFDRVKAEKPDVLLITGDTAEAGDVFAYLGRLGKHTGAEIYYVLGNHDYYGANIASVRAKAAARELTKATWLPNVDPVQLADGVVLVGIDGWADGRCGAALTSKIRLADWTHIHDLRDCRFVAERRVEILSELGKKDAEALVATLAKVPKECKQLVVMTHVPPFPEACVYNGKQSEPDWLPWFTCVATGEVLAEYAANHPEQNVLVLCGHTHGAGVYRHSPNLEVRTGGWAPGVEGYGNPIVQHTFEF